MINEVLIGKFNCQPVVRVYLNSIKSGLRMTNIEPNPAVCFFYMDWRSVCCLAPELLAVVGFDWYRLCQAFLLMVLTCSWVF